METPDVSLYPEMSRQQLELDYHAMLAALCHAAVEKGRTGAAITEQVATWLRDSAGAAAKTAAMLSLHNEMSKGPVH